MSESSKLIHVSENENGEKVYEVKASFRFTGEVNKELTEEEKESLFKDIEKQVNDIAHRTFNNPMIKTNVTVTED